MTIALISPPHAEWGAALHALTATMPQAAPVVPDDSNMLILADYKRRPRRPPFRRVQSVGIGVTSSAQQTSIEAETYTILQSGFCYTDA